jgi:uncharacterized OB-fold protein
MSADSRFDGPGPDALWNEALKAGRLCIQICEWCDGAQFPPALVCRACGKPSPKLVEASGRGTVYSTTTVRSREGAYNVSIIELAEGPRIMSRVDEVPPDDVRIGLPVAAEIVTQAETPVLVFKPEGVAS